ncbi:15163_t:CDS:2 [Cetraspora pellucida]|uniref:15163_t:CDS:1 n=1 Tax=Cetraspora pellucida TaxID=1433469 RepID=A0ACA9P1G4_9GLOM|nr:15163_t:CDS:2 [Cetraspora pellucida]
MSDPEFTGQTKDRLANKKVRELVRNATNELTTNFLKNHPSAAEVISRQVISNAQTRLKLAEQEELLRGASQTRVDVPEGLFPCISKDTELNELRVIEGQSAAGTGLGARVAELQALYAIQGKIINVEKSEEGKILKNKEVRGLINSLGFNVGEATRNYYNRFQEEKIIPAHTPLTREQVTTLVTKTKQDLLKKLRFGKVIIMADADPDGCHIECLLLTLFARYFRYLIEEHQSYRQANKGTAGRLQRIKGLGEMNAPELKETVMSIKKRCLHELLFPNPPSIGEIIKELMGEKSEPRKKYLESGEHKNAQLKVVEASDVPSPAGERVLARLDFGQALLTKFLEYAYKVVEERALPQLQDGLKPVQRRILYTFHELGLLPEKAHRKSAKVVGDVIGRFHPHGSIDGHPPAAMRYTEARLIDNYDETEKEPEVLPANLNLLLNGCSGIAVAMTTDIPPHNLGALVDTTTNLIRNPNLSIVELLQTLQGPDFPTGGIILEKENLLNIYEQGQGTIYVRANAEVVSSEPEKKRKDLIRITSLPYKVNKSKLVAKINQIIKSKSNTVEGLRSVADYSD